MTVSTDQRCQRKNSWDSKMSISTVSTGTRHFRRSPSSILSSDSDIRFTRKKLTSQCRCGCCIIATFLFLLLAAAAAVYIGYTFFLPQDPEEQIYRAMFKVLEGDVFRPELADPNNTLFKTRARDYRERLNLLFRRSPIRHGFDGTEVLALDGTEDKDLVVHFNIHIDPAYVDINEKDLVRILEKEMSSIDSIYFQNLTIDAKSLEIKPIDLILQYSTTTSTTTLSQAVTQTPPPPRKCYQLQLPYCGKIGYNTTTYPNLLNHRNLREVKENVISFRELVDAECYRHAYDFICQVLQPRCSKGEVEDEMVLPCRSYCRDFMAGCGGRLQDNLKELLDCSKFPEYSSSTSCIAKPGCVEELKAKALSPRICDGVVDCQDLTDEKHCTYCGKHQLHCGVGRVCIDSNKRCDGVSDCPDGSDERACLTLTPSIEELKKLNGMTPHVHKYHSDGFVAFNERGEVGKLCTQNLNQSLTSNQTTAVLHTVASSLCKTLTYQNVLSVQVEKDYEPNVAYVQMKDPTAPEISFIRSQCSSKQVLKIACADLECGVQSTHGPNGFKTLPKMANHGDWPWHVALMKEEIHICDGILISDVWVATTSSCFQGQPKAEWTARFGTVRLSGSALWEQERRIVGMVKSPVEGSTIALIKLDQAVAFNDFVRPICLPHPNFNFSKTTDLQCNTMGWARNREQLQRVQVKLVDMQKCENVSISNVNSFCAETVHGLNDCNEEEFAGSPVVCSNVEGDSWSLIGITNWRIACNNGMERPRMYDKITSNINWIRETVSSIDT